MIGGEGSDLGGDDDILATYTYNATTAQLESVVTKCGTTTLESDTYTHPLPGSAPCNQVAVTQVTRRLDTGGTESFYITYADDSLNQLAAMDTYGGVYGDPDPTLPASESWSFDSLGSRADRCV